MQRITGRNVTATLSNGIQILFDQVTLTPDLGFGVAKTQGHPDGWTDGEVGAEGEITVNTVEMLKLQEAAGEAGSWKELAPLDMTFFTLQAGVKMKVEAFGCKLGAPDFTFDATNNERLQHKIAFMVTDPEFIRINGVPLAEAPA